MKKVVIPTEVAQILEALHGKGFEAYVVGGCVRDVLRRLEPEDWDVTTNATPQEIQEIFPDSFYENKFGTVGVKTGSSHKNLEVIEVTTFRIEEKYTDRRHPDVVKFAKTLKEDLSRRDFTVNAMALKIKNQRSKIKNTDQKLKTDEYELIDPFQGQRDIEAKMIRAVGEPEKRFSEDALRLLRAVRFAGTLDYAIEPKTWAAIKKHAGLINFVAKERIKDEIVKIISYTPPEWREAKEDDRRYSNELSEDEVAKSPARAFALMHQSELLKYIIPELEEGIGIEQHLPHRFDVWTHTMRTLAYSVKENFPLEVRLSALFHDIAKPHTKEGEGEESTFYNHQVIGAKLTAQIMSRLRFGRDMIEKVVGLVRWHMFSYDPDITTDSSVRRLMRNVGLENFDDLVKLRLADRVATPVPKAEKYALRHLKARSEILSKDPISVAMLKVNGHTVMDLLKIEPGPKVGAVLNALLEEVLDDPKKNTEEYLEKRIRELGQLADSELLEIGKQGREKARALEGEAERKIKQKYYVK